MPSPWLDRIRDLILRNETVKAAREEIGPDTDLIHDLGLDSIAIVHLLADLEVEFGITIDVEEIGLSLLRELRLLEAYVTSKVAASPGVPAGPAGRGG
ncbi:acyl carrier protein [Paenibacillus albicereus]|uniref:Acyl carrier protein n=1 Tax=Paenibacillus albicereus TaxID=2726185 RepID=A0A6H2H0N7_9BACL|nr:acyl carrier protein [Paenibacillus albicereus]QJC53253.1 acyl carrier protein [Paenibacillus albicereus]